MNTDIVPQTSFRSQCKRYLAPLRIIQIISLLAIVVAVPFAVTIPWLKLLAVAGVAGEVYAFLKLRKITCYHCKRSLAYLFLDPNYSKSRVSFIFPKELPKEITSCPFCHADFEKAEGQDAP